MDGKSLPYDFQAIILIESPKMTDKHNFPPTHTSMINRARIGDEHTRRQALEEFIECYRQPLTQFMVRCLSIHSNDADDLFQEFVLEKILDKNGKVLAMANKQGRFRNALKTSLRNFFVDRYRSKAAEKIERRFEQHLDDNLENELDSVDVLWATALFRSALIRMKNESSHWELFFDRVLTQPPLPYDQIIEKHKYESPAKASNLLITAKRQFNRILTDSITEQSFIAEETSPEEIELEISFLSNMLADSKMLGELVQSLDESKISGRGGDTIGHHSIQIEHFTFMEESPDSSWNKLDASAMIQHLLEQPVSTLIGESSRLNGMTLRQLLLGQFDNVESLDIAKRLKEYFNDRSKNGTSGLPERVDITMTFTSIAKFLLLGGEAERITSMRRDVLTKSLGQLLDKEWLDVEIRNLIGKAVAKLLS